MTHSHSMTGGETGDRGKPVIFSGPMVRALLARRKTQTRRVLKPMRGVTVADCTIDVGPGPSGVGRRLECPPEMLAVPYAVGDRLWVRESLQAKNIDLGGTTGLTEPLTKLDMSRGDVCAAYAADGDDVVDPVRFNLAWLWKRSAVPSIHMPRWASRLTLTVTDVRVQRLQDISEDDAVAEGIVPFRSTCVYVSPAHSDGKSRSGDNAYTMYRDLWNDLHGPLAWFQNPWIAAYTFTVQRGNIDALAETPIPMHGEAR